MREVCRPSGGDEGDVLAAVEARRFLRLWLVERRNELRSDMGIAVLGAELLSDAYRHGVPVGAVLHAVGGDPYRYLRRARQPRLAGRRWRANRLLRLLVAALPSLHRRAPAELVGDMPFKSNT